MEKQYLHDNGIYSQQLHVFLFEKHLYVFNIVSDAKTNNGDSYLGACLPFYSRVYLQNLHLIAVPMQDLFTGFIIFNVI